MDHRPDQAPRPRPRHTQNVPVPDLSASASQQPDFFNEHAEQHQHQHQHQRQQGASTPGYGVAAGWAAGIVVTIALTVFAVWQVNEQIYSPETTARAYLDSLTDGEGSQALGYFSEVPEFAEDPDVDHLLLTGEPLTRSAEGVESAEIVESGDGAQLRFTAGEEDYTTEIPLTLSGTTWGFFDDWQVSPSAITWFQLEVPGAPEGGIGQVEVNGEPVNLDEESARLSAFVPTMAEMSIDTQWLTGAASHVTTPPESSEDPAEEVTIDLEASEEAAAVLHEELATYFEDCDQQVLMPSGCSVGISTTHQVDANTIDWTFPDPEDFELTFDAEGWQVSYDEPVAEVSFDAIHHHTGEALTETEDVPFSLDIEVRASGEDLLVSVTDGE